ncbi:MAG: sulfatase [Planctomycetes bacterium]|nr:sulfatase [Planctomycetota bacterium]
MTFFLRLALILGVCASLAIASAAQADSSRPNIILLISDDHDYEHFGFMGHPIAHTPTIDRLARQGTVFTTAHLPMSRCHPTLASLLSGRHPHQSGVYYNFKGPPLDETNSLPLLLKQAGYLTYCEGKYWEGDPRRMGFTHGAGKTAGSFVRKGQEALFEFLENAGEQPFFVWWAPMLPHTPHNPPQRHLKKFDATKFPIPDYLAPEQREEFLKKEHLSYAMEAWMDEGAGQLLARLEELGKDENTLIVFVIDNGWCNGLVSKGSPREKGVRTPVVFHWPGKAPKGKSSDALISTIDVTPTILDYAGVAVPDSYAGRSLRPMIEGEEDLAREALFEAIYPAFATESGAAPENDIYALSMRDRRWKYTLYLQDVRRSRNGDYLRIQSILTGYPTRDKGDEDLYDLQADPYEQHNLAADPGQQDRLTAMKAAALKWWRETGGGELDVGRKR